MNISTGIVLGIVIAVFIAVVVRELYNRRNGRGSCSCGCGGCAMKDTCHTAKEDL